MKAIVDLGTNTFNLLVYEQGEAGLRILHSVELPVFLGKGGIEQGRITDQAYERGMEALRTHKATAMEHGATSIHGFGTSMLRNARNGEDFVRRAKQELGIAIRIIPGEQEADLILAGVRQAVAFGKLPSLVMDIGGGSTEFILATDKALMWKRSFELGVTRLRERIPISDPITVEEEARIAAHLDDQLEGLYAVVERQEPHVLVGSAGSFDSLARIISAERGEALAPDEVTLRFTALEFDALKDRLLRMDRAQRLQVHGLPEHRVDTIPYALIQIDRVLLAGGIREMAWSRYALKEGAAVMTI
ncbi:MAG: phosphatase [Flavobacteriales bacterium]|nr:phosphatase [Flavobacteriales bacterium]